MSTESFLSLLPYFLFEIPQLRLLLQLPLSHYEPPTSFSVMNFVSSVYLSLVPLHLNVLQHFKPIMLKLSHSPFPVLVSGVLPGIGHPNVVILSSSLLVDNTMLIFLKQNRFLQPVPVWPQLISLSSLCLGVFNIFLQSLLHTATPRIIFLNHSTDLVTSLLTSLWQFPSSQSRGLQTLSCGPSLVCCLLCKLSIIGIQACSFVHIVSVLV